MGKNLGYFHKISVDFIRLKLPNYNPDTDYNFEISKPGTGFVYNFQYNAKGSTHVVRAGELHSVLDREEYKLEQALDNIKKFREELDKLG